MPLFDTDDARIHYELCGDPAGEPVLLIAPGGMRSTLERWGALAWNPMTALGDYRVIAMDQRGAGASSGALAEGWETYTADQLGLLDHLGAERFHALGMCIGGAYIMGLARMAPERLASAVMFQPIGLEGNRHVFHDLFDGWAAEQEADPALAARLRRAMWGGDFLFNGTREEAAAFPAPLFVFMGDDVYHPSSISRELAGLAPGATLVERWKDDPRGVDSAVKGFLERNGV